MRQYNTDQIWVGLDVHQSGVTAAVLHGDSEKAQVVNLPGEANAARLEELHRGGYLTSAEVPDEEKEVALLDPLGHLESEQRSLDSEDRAPLPDGAVAGEHGRRTPVTVMRRSRPALLDRGSSGRASACAVANPRISA
jgi:hypothetical protein